MSTGEDFGESIHMVPFQFDLIQLLPKCQQVELFFLTFSTGTCVLAVHTDIIPLQLNAWTRKKCVCVPSLVFPGWAENREHGHGSLCLPNDILLSLFHSSLELELSDKEIPLATSDHGAFMHHILGRERDGHGAPFSLPLIKGQQLNPLAQGSRSQSVEILSLGRPSV